MELVQVLRIVAVVLFIIAAIPARVLPYGSSLLAAGLAFFAASFLEF